MPSMTPAPHVRRAGRRLHSEPIPPAPFYVVAADPHMSDSGRTGGRRAIVVCPCVSKPEADVVLANISRREDVTDARIVTGLIDRPDTFVSVLTRDQNPIWYRRDGYRVNFDPTFRGFATWATWKASEAVELDAALAERCKHALATEASGKNMKAFIERALKRTEEGKQLITKSLQEPSERIHWPQVIDHWRAEWKLERRETSRLPVPKRAEKPREQGGERRSGPRQTTKAGERRRVAR